MTLTPEQRAVLEIVRRQYPGSITSRSVTAALVQWKFKERRVENILNELCKRGLVTYARPNGIGYYTYSQKQNH